MDETKTATLVEYYPRAFALFHEQLNKSGYDLATPHRIRARFWGLLPRRKYAASEARPIVEQYLSIVEREMASIIEKHSLAYWLHVCRRLEPGGVGVDPQPYTAGLVVATLEAAIQKYALLTPCEGVGVSGDIALADVLGGLLMSPEFGVERHTLSINRQLVLTKFGHLDLRDFYELKKLAYEIWRSTAQLRILGKGATLVTLPPPVLVADTRTDQLNTLVRSYDRRIEEHEGIGVSSTGMVFSPSSDEMPILLPTLNLDRTPSDTFNSFFEPLGLRLATSIVFNFGWFQFSLRAFRLAHLPFETAFADKYKTQLDDVLSFVAALGYRTLASWHQSHSAVMNSWLRAYEGPLKRDEVAQDLRAFLPHAARVLSLTHSEEAGLDLESGMAFFELHPETRTELDIAYPGPHQVLLRFDAERVFIDQAWIARRLHHLFVGVPLEEQHFKGPALEKLVHAGRSILPHGPCKAGNERKQIDAAFEVDDRLVIAECRAVGRSIGFSRGLPDAMQFRERKLDKSLADVDDKARWLAAHPVGANYDINRYSGIVPIVVTPFAEYIPSLNSRYWLTETWPRVLAPGELSEALAQGIFRERVHNLVAIGH